MSDLDNILNDDEQTEALDQQEAPVEPTPEPEATPKGNEEGAMPAPEDEPTEKTIPIQSYQAEKQKRQEWERRYQQDIETLRREMEALKAPKEPEAPPPNIWEDDQAWQQHFGKQVTSQAAQMAAQQSRLQTSELLMMQQHEDFAQAKDEIFRFVGENPSVNAEVQNSPHPWQAAYKAYKNHQTMQQLGTTDLTEIEAKLREKIMAEMQEQTPPQPNIPQSLADAQSIRQSAQAKPNNLSLDDILGG